MSDRLKDAFYPIITFVFMIGAWSLAYNLQLVPDTVLPGPKAVAEAFWNGYANGTLWPHLATTATETVLGFLLGSVVALCVGGLVSEVKLVERLIYPYIVALQSMPKVALAPLLIVWFGFGIASKVVLVALISFFPMFVNVVAGLRSARPELVDMYTAFSASRWQIFRDIKLPSAMGSIFAGLQIALVLALLGAVVGEFVAAQQGLGSLIQAASLNFDLPIMFACIITLAMMGAFASMLMRAVQRRVVFWESAQHRATTTK